ncbi:DUF423 domain-containing protein [Fulvimarina sp. MAC8]|uniref:DUF423 domain-containing protein n=1 Tax=Fulvimarina sp. MAC8 TaxID=3162874 RepID=UPI0032EC6205
MRRAARATVQFLGALVGASGVAFAAYASHGTADQALAVPAAGILLAHAPVLLALSIMADRAPRLIGLIALGMTVGLALFAGDLAARIWLGNRLFQGAAPLGGGMIILSWLLLAVEALVSGLVGGRSALWRGKQSNQQGPQRVSRIQ